MTTSRTSGSATGEQVRLELMVSMTNDTATMALIGEVDHDTSTKLRSVQRGVLALGARSVILDWSEVTFVDGGGLDAIVELWQGIAGRHDPIPIGDDAPATGHHRHRRSRHDHLILRTPIPPPGRTDDAPPLYWAGGVVAPSPRSVRV